jgi:hypothetical protein
MYLLAIMRAEMAQKLVTDHSRKVFSGRSYLNQAVIATEAAKARKLSISGFRALRAPHSER